MSNRQKIKPPESIRRYARNVRCSDCDSDTGQPWYDNQLGIWRVSIKHDHWCPVLNGQVSTLAMHREAAS